MKRHQSLRKVVLAAAFMVSCVSAYAQGSLQIAFGYGIPASAERFLTDENIVDGKIKAAGIYASLGKGTRISVGYGYTFKNSIGLGIDIDRVFGAPVVNVVSRKSGSTTQLSTETYVSDFWEISPSMRINFKFNASDKLSYFLKFGPTIGTGGMTVKGVYSETLGTFTTDYYEFTREYEGSATLGFKMQGGVEWPVSSFLSILLQLDYTNLIFSPDKATVTSFITSGQNQVGLLTVYQTLTEFRESISITSSPPPNDPRQLVRPTIPWNSLALKIGVKFEL